MNIDLIKNEIKKHVNDSVTINVYAMRNKSYQYHGIIKKMYPNIFSVITASEEKTFSYADVATGDVKITYN